MQVGANRVMVLQQLMAMRTPEILAVMPEVEQTKYEDRVALVERGAANISALIKHWDKFSTILAARGEKKNEIKARLKRIKEIRSKLEWGMRLADKKKTPLPYQETAEQGFNVLVGWFMVHMGELETVLKGPKLDREAIRAELLPQISERPLPVASNEDDGEVEGLTDRMHMGAVNARISHEDDGEAEGIVELMA